MAEKCSSHKSHKRRKFLKRCFSGLLICAFIILVIVLLVYAVLQPKKPRFVLLDATVFNLTVTSPNIISATIQITINTRNPNDNIGVYYERMRCYAVYRHQQITAFTTIPSVYQGHKDVIVWSPFVVGDNVPVAPFNGLALSQDANYGGMPVVFKIDGRVRWKVGSLIIGRYRLHVSCEAFIPTRNHQDNNGILIGAAVKFQFQQGCSVSV